MPEAGRSVVEPCLLVSGRGSPEHLVAMRKSTESRHDVAVAPGVLQGLIELAADPFVEVGGVPGEILEERYGESLHGARLGVFERHIGKASLDDVQRSIGTAVDQGHRGLNREGVPAEGAAGASKGVARELVEDDDSGEAGAGVSPLIERGHERPLDGLEKLVAYLFVDGLTAAPPELFPEP